MGSLELVRVAGLRSPLKPLTGTRWYLGRLLPALSLARWESVTSASRRVPAIWEVAHRAGIASLVVNWWTTYPAETSGATVISNHLFFAARAGLSLEGEGWPREAAEKAAGMAPRVAPEPGSLERLIADARGLDEFCFKVYQDLFRRNRPRLSLLYLPGLDVLASALSDPARDAGDRVALATALKEEALNVRQILLGDALREGVDLLVVVLDSGRRGRSGMIWLEGPLARSGIRGKMRAVDLAPTVLAALGVPASREADGRVHPTLLTPGAVNSSTVASWGRRRARAAPLIDPREYVENLRSLGYLK